MSPEDYQNTISEIKTKISLLDQDQIQNKDKIKEMRESLNRLHARMETNEKITSDIRSDSNHEIDLVNHRLQIVDSLNSGHKQAINSLGDAVSALKELTTELKRESVQNKEDNNELKIIVRQISNTLKQFVWMGAGMGFLLIILFSGAADKFITVAQTPAISQSQSIQPHNEE